MAAPCPAEPGMAHARAVVARAVLVAILWTCSLRTARSCPSLVTGTDSVVAQAIARAVIGAGPTFAVGPRPALRAVAFASNALALRLAGPTPAHTVKLSTCLACVAEMAFAHAILALTVAGAIHGARVELAGLAIESFVAHARPIDARALFTAQLTKLAQRARNDTAVVPRPLLEATALGRRRVTLPV